MCGFCGFTGNLENREQVIEKMMDRIVHRGPDSGGVHSDEEVTFGFRRLSIIGLEDGSQPIYNEDRSVVIVFNGEIYNYQSLKEDLIAKGHTFYTHADTEVLVHLYEEKGEDMLNDLRGMFAFTIYDMKNKKLLLQEIILVSNLIIMLRLMESFYSGLKLRAFCHILSLRKR